MKEQHIKEFEEKLEKCPYDHSTKCTAEAVGSDDAKYIKMIQFIMTDILLKTQMVGTGTLSECAQQVEILLRKCALDEDPTKLRLLALLITEGIEAKMSEAMDKMEEIIFENAKGDDNDEDNNK